MIGSSEESIEVTSTLDTLENYFSELHENHVTMREVTSCMEIMDSILGFSISRSKSTVSGTGVFVSSGLITKGSLVALYPGMFITLTDFH